MDDVDIKHRVTSLSLRLQAWLTVPLNAAVAGLTILVIVLAALLIAAMISFPAQDKEMALERMPADWQLVETDLFSFRIPKTMEVRRSTAVINDVAEALHTKAGKKGVSLVVQPRGQNDLLKESFQRYSRILATSAPQEPGVSLTQDQLVTLSTDQLQELGDAFRQRVDKEMVELDAVLPGKKNVLLDWEPLRLTKIGNRTALHIRFRRQAGANVPVRVQEFVVLDGRLRHEVTFSYRETENAIWKDDFEGVVSTFRFKDN